MSAIGTNSVSGAALSSMRAKASDAVASLAGVFPTQHIPNSHGHAYSVNLAQTQPGAQTTYHMAPAQHQAHPNQHHLTVQHQHQASQHQQNVAQQQQQVAADHFFQQLQQTATAAAALPNVLSPYDHHNQSPYIGQLMYFPYPSAAAAANSLFTNSPSTTEHQVHQQSQTISAVANSAALSAVTSQATVVVAPASATLHQHQQNGMAPAGSAVSAATLAPLLTSAANLYPQHTNVNTNCTQSSLQPQGQTSNIQPQQISVQSVTSSGNAITTLASSIGASLGGTTLCTNSILNASAATIADLDKLLPAVPKLEATTAVLSSDGGPLNGGQLITPPAKRDNNGTGQFICGVCGREFGMRCRLIAHTRRHTGERPFPCVECGRAFSDRGNLQRHRYTHSSNPRFHCNVCGKAFRQASCLSNHRRFHCAGASGRPCPFCARSFRSSSSLQMHIRWKHRADAAAAIAAATAVAVIGGAGATGGSVDSNVGIRINGSSLISGNENVLGGGITSGNIGMSIGGSLNPNNRKWRRKSKPKQVHYNAFGKLTTDGTNLLSGIHLSEGVDVNAAAAAAGAAAASVGGPVPLDRKGRPCAFPCPACPRRFAFQCRLAAHLRCHTNIRPFICTDCGRAFTQKGYLARHAAVHKLDRPFCCSLCDRSYKHYGSLVNHRRTHGKVAGLAGDQEMADQLVSAVGSSGVGAITLMPVSKVEEILPCEYLSSQSLQASSVAAFLSAGTLGSPMTNQTANALSNTSNISTGLGITSSSSSTPACSTGISSVTAVSRSIGAPLISHLASPVSGLTQLSPIQPAASTGGQIPGQAQQQTLTQLQQPQSVLSSHLHHQQPQPTDQSHSGHQQQQPHHQSPQQHHGHLLSSTIVSSSLGLSQPSTVSSSSSSSSSTTPTGGGLISLSGQSLSGGTNNRGCGTTTTSSSGGSNNGSTIIATSVTASATSSPAAINNTSSMAVTPHQLTATAVWPSSLGQVVTTSAPGLLHPSNNVAIGQPGSTPGSAGHAALSGNRILLGAASDNCATTATSAVPTAATMTVTTNAATTPIGHMAHLQQQQATVSLHNAMNVSGNLCDVTSGISAGTAGVAGAPVLHLLQPPTAGIFLSGYYPLPHSTPTATQPM